MLRQEIAWFDQKVNSTGALATRLASDASAVKGVSPKNYVYIATHTLRYLLVCFLPDYWNSFWEYPSDFWWSCDSYCHWILCLMGADTGAHVCLPCALSGWLLSNPSPFWESRGEQREHRGEWADCCGIHWQHWHSGQSWHRAKVLLQIWKLTPWTIQVKRLLWATEL